MTRLFTLLTLLAACEREPEPCAAPGSCADDSPSTQDSDPPAEEDDCSPVQAVLDARCVSCHGDFAVDGLDLRDVSASVGVESGQGGGALIAPGDAEGSYLLAKMRGTHLSSGGAGVRMPPGVEVPEEELSLVAAWIDEGASCDGEPPEHLEAEYDPNALDQDALFACDGRPSSSPGRLRRIDKHQLRRRAGRSWDHELAANPLEAPGAARYSTYAEGVSLDVATLDLYLDMLPHAVGPWVGESWWDRDAAPIRLGEVDCIFDDEAPDEACVSDFAWVFLETAALRRAPEPAEVERLTQFALEVLAEEASSGASREESVTMIASAGWLHTHALFTSEIGDSEPDADGRRCLSADERATMIAGMLSDRGHGAASVYFYDNDLSGDDRFTDDRGPHMPALTEAALDGSVEDPAVAAALLRRYAMGLDPDREDVWVDYGSHSLDQRHDRAEPWMADRLERFFLEWFDVLSFESGFQDTPNATTAWGDDDPLYYQRSLDELRAYEGWSEPSGLMLFTDTVARVVNEDQDVLARLLTTNTWYLPATSGSTDYSHRLFGLADSVAATREGRWNTLPASERAGLLTHPVWLAAHGDAFEDGASLVLRGKWVRERLLCETVPPLELVSVAAMLPDSDGSLSARQRVEQGIETQAECMGCHQYMNSLGAPFEAYNHAGGLRVEDHGQPPDGSSVVDNAPDPALNQAYADPAGFVSALAGSEHVKRCFIRHSFRFFAGRDETMADGCALVAMEDAYDSSGGSFVSMLEALATHDTMTCRSEGVSP